MPKSKPDRPPEAKSTLRMKKRLAPLLRQWYGEREGAGELVKHLPRPQPVSEILDRVAKKKVPPAFYAFSAVQAQWERIAGSVAARHTRPLSLADGILMVEIAHPAYLAAVNNPTVKRAILDGISAATGMAICSEIRFVPRGRTAAPFRRA